MECWVVRPTFPGGNFDLGVISMAVKTQKQMKYPMREGGPGQEEPRESPLFHELAEEAMTTMKQPEI